MLAIALALQLTATAAAPTVYVFVTTDCPISNRYAPEIARLKAKFDGTVRFMIVYPVPADTDEKIREHVTKFGYGSGQWTRDAALKLVRLTGVKVTPEVAIVDGDHRVLYRGRIDDRYIEFGKDRPEPTVRDLERSLEAVLAGRAVPIKETQAIGCILSDLMK
jgi:hypothetical protein